MFATLTKKTGVYPLSSHLETEHRTSTRILLICPWPRAPNHTTSRRCWHQACLLEKKFETIPELGAQRTAWEAGFLDSCEEPVPPPVAASNQLTFNGLRSLVAEKRRKQGRRPPSLEQYSFIDKKNGLVRQYCKETAVCGTVPPLSLSGLVVSIGLCGQGSC